MIIGFIGVGIGIGVGIEAVGERPAQLCFSVFYRTSLSCRLSEPEADTDTDPDTDGQNKSTHKMC